LFARIDSRSRALVYLVRPLSNETMTKSAARDVLWSIERLICMAMSEERRRAA
jgi:hypothetical protein